MIIATVHGNAATSWLGKMAVRVTIVGTANKCRAVIRALASDKRSWSGSAGSVYAMMGDDLWCFFVAVNVKVDKLGIRTSNQATAGALYIWIAFLG